MPVAGVVAPNTCVAPEQMDSDDLIPSLQNEMPELSDMEALLGDDAKDPEGGFTWL